ncbi:hypothetical protein ABOM_004500 [Aspergillus bombycis]|uniref:Tat pathway signal sequence n=1 Tax=Aspergillus bombycis TaxID=109264 RepID=A0A1F8A5E0_9EURO|nr:hypothetical protein ABOM_004500 [Aspergillus bombycis]OGM46914.1 hypothetical protein ABOM_004500 [Aspergillus bombycis]
MDDQAINLAQLHYIAEQQARHSCIWEGQEHSHQYPNFKESWASVTPILRQEYTERVQILASTPTPMGAQADYEGILKPLYETYFASMTQLEAEMTSSIPISIFKAQLAHLGKEALPESCQETDDEGGKDGNDDDAAYSNDEDAERTERNISPIHDLTENEDPMIPTLESAVDAGVLALENLQRVLNKSDVWLGDANWKDDIELALSLSQTEKVIIGVVGSTGVGKSSLINAIAEEENILATNCMRASTAVATELSYNDGEFRYKARIEFIQRSEWEHELRILFKELCDSLKDVTRENIPKDSNAGIALDKIKAVYPSLEMENITNTSVEKLLEDQNVLSLLGSTLIFEEDKPRVFSRKLKSYIDSNGKRCNLKNPSQRSSDIGLWPLIRVVRIYVKARVLSTGAVLVDLPGVFDSNAARVAVAEDYMKRCSAHWVVSPINRAVDDKVAHDLLGQNFKMQMHMDCAFNNITFICTKTDDISVSEVQDSLRLVLPSVKKREQQNKLCAQLQVEVIELEKRKERILDDIGSIADEIEELEASLYSKESHLSQSGNMPNEEKMPSEVEMSKTTDPNKNDMATAPVDVSTAEVQKSSHSETEDRMRQHQALKAERKQLEHQRRQLNQQIKSKKAESKRLEEETENMKTGIIRECINARNIYSKDEIKKGFACGIHELDQEFGEDEDQIEIAGINLPARDYEKLANELPVFCVSTKAYQKLCGRLRKEVHVTGFAKPEDTEIPQLQRHCINLTEKAREASALRFLAQLKRLFQSLSLWSLATSPAHIMSDEKIRELEAGFNLAVDNLRKAMEKRVCEHSDALLQTFEVNIINRLDRAVKHACGEIPRIISQWNAPRNEGGLAFNTYQAICRRQGVFKERDWNQELANPLLDRIVGGWTRTFCVKVPLHLNEFAVSLEGSLQDFHSRAMALADKGAPIGNTEIPEVMLSTYCKTLGYELKPVEASIKSEQKELNRMFAKTIEAELHQAYQECAEQSGQYSLIRMKNIMTRQAADNCSYVLRTSVERALQEIMDLLNATRERLGHLVESTVNHVSHDYRTAIVEPQIRKFSHDQINLKNEVTKIIQGTEAKIHLDQLLGLNKEPNGQTVLSAASEVLVKSEEEPGVKYEEIPIQVEDIWGLHPGLEFVYNDLFMPEAERE